MKQLFIVFMCLATFVQAQEKREKIRGSKNVTVKRHVIESFAKLEVNDDIEVILIPSSETAVEIEADDNLHEVYTIEASAEKLSLSTTHNIFGAKENKVRVYYSPTLQEVVLNNKADITTSNAVKAKKFTVRASGNSLSKMILHVSDLTLDLKEKAHIKVEAVSDTLHYSVTDNATLKGYSKSFNSKIDLYLKGDITLEGSTQNINIRTGGDADFDGEKFLAASAKVIAESDSKTIIHVSKHVLIEADGDAEIQLYGSPKIQIDKFEGESKLLKKE